MLPLYRSARVKQRLRGCNPFHGSDSIPGRNIIRGLSTSTKNTSNYCALHIHLLSNICRGHLFLLPRVSRSPLDHSLQARTPMLGDYLTFSEPFHQESIYVSIAGRDVWPQYLQACKYWKEISRTAIVPTQIGGIVGNTTYGLKHEYCDKSHQCTSRRYMFRDERHFRYLEAFGISRTDALYLAHSTRFALNNH